jgi:hypothetical protein
MHDKLFQQHIGEFVLMY